MQFLRDILYHFREERPIFSRKDLVTVAGLYGGIHRFNAIIEGVQNKIRKGGEVSETDAQYMFDVARGGLERIREYESKVDVDIRNRLDNERGGGDLAISEIKRKFEYVISAMAPPSEE